MKVKSIVLVAASALMLTACGSVSTLKSSWLKEKYTFKNDHAQKVLLVALAKDESVRRKVEDDMKSVLVGRNVEISTSYNFVKYGTSQEELMEFIDLGNFSHIITMRVADVEKEIEYTPGRYYASGYQGYYPAYYGYYGSYFGRVWSTGYTGSTYQENVEYTIETNVYSVKEKEMVYSALTSTFKGSGLDQTVFATLEQVAKDLKKRGLINEKK